MLNTETLRQPDRQLQLEGLAPMRPSPVCDKCGHKGPTINGRCADHLTLAQEGALYCVSPEDLEEAGLL